MKRFNKVDNTLSILKTWNGSCTPDLCTGMAADGDYKIEIGMTDRAGNKNSTNLTETIKLDTTPSQISFAPPTPNNEILTTSNSIIVNITVNENVSAMFEWNGTNETINGSAANWFREKTDLQDGNYTFKVYVNDSAGNKNVSETRWVFVNVGRNITSAINNISQKLSGSNITVSLLNSTGNPADSSHVFAFESYTLQFNLINILIETADFTVDKLNSSANMSITRNLTAESNLSKTFNESGGALDSYVWIDLNSLLPEGSYTARITFPKVYGVHFYLNGLKDAPNFTGITDVCNTDFSNKPCYNITANTTTLYLPSFSGAAAGNDTQVPSLSVSSPVTPTTYSSSSVPLTYSVSDNVAVDKCLYRLNSDSNITLNGCTNTTITASQGSNTLALYANDTSGNEIKSIITFTFAPPSGGGGGGSSGSSSSTATSSTATTSTTSSAPSSPTTSSGASAAQNTKAQANNSSLAAADNSPEEIETASDQENQTINPQNVTETTSVPATGLVTEAQLPVIVGGIIIIAAAVAAYLYYKNHKNRKHPKKKKLKRAKFSKSAAFWNLGEASLLPRLKKTKARKTHS